MISINNLKFSYGSKVVLENICMELKDGSIYGLLGENGVGKTTLLSILMGLKKAQEGTVTIDGDSPIRRNPSLIQDIIFLQDEVTPVAEKAISFAKSMGAFRPRFDLEKFERILSDFEVDPNQKMNSMSQGQLKKTYIAFALASNVKYLLLDEPTNGLDIPSKAQFRKVILSETREDGVVLISTHQIRDLENIIDPVIILDNREVLLNASAQEISDKLFFDYGSELKHESLYSELTAGSMIQVYPNTLRQESKVNIEALFNATHAHKDIIKALFNNE